MRKIFCSFLRLLICNNFSFISFASLLISFAILSPAICSCWTDVFSYDFRAFKHWWPDHSAITFSVIPALNILVIEVAHNEWFEYLFCSPAFSKMLGIIPFMVLIPTSCFVYQGLLASLGILGNGRIYKYLASGGNLLMYVSSNLTKHPGSPGTAYARTCLLCKSMSLNLCWLFLDTNSVYW